MGIHWVTEQERREMREAAAERARDDALFTLFAEFLREKHPDGCVGFVPETPAIVRGVDVRQLPCDRRQ